MNLTRIAHVENDFPDKFGLPRQGAAGQMICGKIVFEKAFALPDAVRGLEGFDRLWIIWGFDVPQDRAFHATVRPPKLGGNTRVGVFATRSPFRPNPLGLTCVRLEGIEAASGTVVLRVSGLDMKDGTPVYDIKPYLPWADAFEDAAAGFADSTSKEPLTVHCGEDLLTRLEEGKRAPLLDVLSKDPRPGYVTAPGEYGMHYAGKNIRFTVDGRNLTVTDIREES